MYFAIDSETTGFYAYEEDEILSFAYIYLNADLVELTRKQYFVLPSPGHEVSAEAAAKNGYTPELWAERGAIPQDEFFAALAADWKLLGVDRAWPLGQNVRFDMSFLDARGRKDPGFRQAQRDALSYHLVDTISLAVPFDTAHRVRGAKYSLTDLCERWGVPLVHAHDSMSDIEATVALYRKLVERLGTVAAPALTPQESFKASIKSRAAQIREQLAGRRGE